MIELINGGLLTTVQDSGRFGFQFAGVPVCGAMDIRALRTANSLVGNDYDEAAIELTLQAPELLFKTGNIFAVTGAELDLSLNGKPIEMAKAQFAPEGSVLTMGYAKKGMRAYVAFAGGLKLPLILGSHSTCITAKFGGYQGRNLLSGDVLDFKHPQTWLPNFERRVAFNDYDNNRPIRVLPGIQHEYFSEYGIKTFLSSEYFILPESNRQGCRLKGCEIEFKEGFGANIISDGIAMGSIQVTEALQPIIMMADRQTTGGYAKIASVISADLPLLAQKRPGDKVCFELVDLEFAHAMLRKEQHMLEDLSFWLNCQLLW